MAKRVERFLSTRSQKKIIDNCLSNDTLLLDVLNGKSAFLGRFLTSIDEIKSAHLSKDIGDSKEKKRAK